MLRVTIGADGFQEFHLLFDILTCQLSRRYCVIGRETKTHTNTEEHTRVHTRTHTHTHARTHMHTHKPRAENPSYYCE